MSKSTSRLCAAAALAATAFAGAGAARADVLFDNGATGYGSGYSLISVDADNGPGIAANSFTLSHASTLNQVIFDSWTVEGDKVTDLQWAILDAAGPAGNNALYVGSANVTSTHIVENYYNDDINANSFTLPNLNLAAGTYWLELGYAESTYGYGVGWDQTDGGAQFYTNQPWPNPPGDANTFTILGTTGPTRGDGGTPITPVGPGAGGVPEPATWALMLLGFGGLGAALRSARRRGALAA